MPFVIQIKQEVWPRSNGWQLTQWVSRVPVGATSPDSLEALFVVRNVHGRESFERVASLSDFAALAENPMAFYEPRGENGSVLLSQAVAGDTLRISGDATLHWVQQDPPYDDRDFLVNSRITRESGVSPAVLLGAQLRLPGHVWKDEDVGRWVYLTGFVTNTSYNGYAQILGHNGSTATIDKVVATAESSPGTWDFHAVAITHGILPFTVEPRYFPERRAGLPWELLRSGASVTSGNSGATYRQDGSSTLFRSVRWTSIEPSLQAAQAFAAVVLDGVRRLQREAALSGTGSHSIVTTTVGP